MKKNFILIFLFGLTSMLVSCSKEIVDDTSDNHEESTSVREIISVNVSTPGTLQSIIESSKEFGDKTTQIKVEGSINGSDLKYLRALVGYKYDGLNVTSKISSIDLTATTFSVGGDMYYKYESNGQEFSVTTSTRLPYFLFAGCVQLKEIHLNPKYDIIPYGAFYECTNLNTITHGNLTKIENRAFLKCKNLKEFDFTKVSESIGDYAFWNGYVIAQGLECEVYLNPTIKYVGIGAFYNTKITKVTINSDIAISNDIDDHFWHMIYGEFSNCDKLTTVTVAEGCTKLELNFSGCSKLASVSLPPTLKSIGVLPQGEYDVFHTSGHFALCKSLETINLPSNLSYIGDGCFRKSAIKKIKMPSSLKVVGNGAFTDCAGLSAVEFSGADTQIKRSCFKGCTILAEIIMPSSLSALEDSVFKDCSNLSKIVLPESLKKMSDYIFAGCSVLNDIVLPENVDSIGTYVFKDCNQLKSIKLPSKLEELPEGMFYGCKSLKTIDLPETINEIGALAFAYSMTENITLPPLLEKIPDYCFAGCQRLQSVEMKENIKEIGVSGFYGCSGLARMRIDAIIPPLVGENAFTGVPFTTVDLIVPEESRHRYMEDREWGRFFEH